MHTPGVPSRVYISSSSALQAQVQSERQEILSVLFERVHLQQQRIVCVGKIGESD